MENIELEQRLKDIIEWQLRLLEQKTQHSIEWSQFRHVVQNELVNPIISTVVESFRDLENENKRLSARLSISTLSANGRNQRIIDLRQKGLSLRQIGREVGLNQEGVNKILKKNARQSKLT